MDVAHPFPLLLFRRPKKPLPRHSQFAAHVMPARLCRHSPRACASTRNAHTHTHTHTRNPPAHTTIHPPSGAPAAPRSCMRCPCRSRLSCVTQNVCLTRGRTPGPLWLPTKLRRMPPTLSPVPTSLSRHHPQVATREITVRTASSPAAGPLRWPDRPSRRWGPVRRSCSRPRPAWAACGRPPWPTDPRQEGTCSRLPGGRWPRTRQ